MLRAIIRTAGLLRGPAVLVAFCLTAACVRPSLQAAPAAVRDRGGIGAIQQRLRSVPADWQAWAGLGASYVQEARRTGDPTYYPKADEALRRSLHIRPTDNADAMIGLGALAAARHDFVGALSWGDRARAIDPYSSSTYGVIGDALVELGRYKEAFKAIQHMVDLQPGLASYARVSYVLELQGDTSGATAAMKMAADAASNPSDSAFADYYLGELYWNSGRTDDAARMYTQSNEHDATYVPALQGLAKVRAARGDLPRAVAGYEDVVARFPLPQFVGELADVATAAGQPALAKEERGLLDIQRKLFRANGVNVDLDEAVFDADHHIGRDRGLDAARREWARRKSIVVADALAWALHANGRDHEALTYARTALRLGTRSALFFFHEGMIERSLGLRTDAHADLSRAASINRNFSFVWGPKLPSLIASVR